MQRLRAICDEHGIMLIADEVQSGAGRTGTLFAMEQMGVAPDITTFAKSIAGGFPLAGVTGRAEAMDAIPPGGLGGTYAGNPIACAAALAVLNIFEQENLLQKPMTSATPCATACWRLPKPTVRLVTYVARGDDCD